MRHDRAEDSNASSRRQARAVDNIPRWAFATPWTGTDRGAQAVLAAGVQQRLVRVSDLVAEVERNERLYRRKVIKQTLGDIAGGAHALSELDFTQLVVRQFKLPAPDRQVPLRDAHGRRRRLDAVWEKAQLVVEIDRAGHIDVAAQIRQALREAGYAC